MSKGILFVIGAIVVVGGGYFLLGGTSGMGESMEKEVSSGTFASLMASGQNLECTFTHDDGTNVSSGTVYLASGGERIRGDFSIQQSAAGAMTAHLIRDGGYNYLWGSMMAQGIKTQVTAENEGKLFDEETGAVDENTDFECRPWAVDESRFAIPSEVTFTDFGAQMQLQGEVQGSGDMKAMQCAACNQLPEGAARQQCLQALSCN